MDINGQNKQQITANIGDEHPLWSPNKKMISFERGIGSNYDGGYIIYIENKKQKKIWDYRFVNWAWDNDHIWTDEGLIDLNGHLIVQNNTYANESGQKKGRFSIPAMPLAKLYNFK
jgi:Tol biopolymer transport system component